MDKNEVIEMAKKYAHNNQQVTIVYYDEDMEAFWYISESGWDMLCDNRQVEPNWLIAVFGE